MIIKENKTIKIEDREYTIKEFGERIQCDSANDIVRAIIDLQERVDLLENNA